MTSVNASPQVIDLTIQTSDVEGGTRKIIQAVRPNWVQSDLKFKYFDEGITNVLLGCFTAPSFSEADDVIVVRIFGKKTELIINRTAERNNMVRLSQAGLCPPLYAEFNNGIAYGFAPGITLDEKSVRDSKIRKLIAKEMVKLHCISSEPNIKPQLFEKLTDWLKVVPEKFDDPDKQAIFVEKIPSKEILMKEMLELKNHLDALKCPVVFSHNDLLLKNIIYNSKTEGVTFIDQEYGMMNYQPFDIGNHFCEYAGIGDVTDYSLYPDQDYQLEWIRTYLEEWHKVTGKSLVSDQDVWTMYCNVNKCALAAHYFWGLWAILQAKFSEINFDYLGYAVIRLDEYFAKKEKFLALK